MFCEVFARVLLSQRAAVLPLQSSKRCPQITLERLRKIKGTGHFLAGERDSSLGSEWSLK